MVIISDTTALSNLIKLGKLHYLKEIFHKIIIPKAVYHELIPLKGYRLDLTEIENGDWVQIEIAEKGVLYTELLQKLDLGETEAIVLAQQVKADYLIMDEKKGRLEAAKLGIKTIGLLGILILCRRSGICTNLKAEMDDLRLNAGFWINEKLYQEVIEFERLEFS